MSTVKKPWGEYNDLYRSKEVVLKIITIDPHEEISYQYHNQRSELWFVKSGMGVLTHNDRKRLVSAGDHFTIGQGSKHKIENKGDVPVEIFEMQCGICLEDDIVRLDDKYER